MFLQVKHLVDRVFTEFLYPTSEQPSRLILSNSMTETSNTLNYLDNMMLPEEMELVGPGTVIEIDYEQIIVGGVSEGPNVLSFLLRGINGTLAEEHAQNSLILVSPTWTKKMVLDAVSDSIVELWPRLYTVEVDEGVSVVGGVAAVDPSAEDVVSVFDVMNGYDKVDFQFRKYTRSTPTNKSVVCLSRGPVDIAYKVRPKRPLDHNQLLSTVNVSEEWSSVIVLGAMISLLAKPDIERMMTDFLVDRMKAESVRVGTGHSLREGLIQLYEYKMSKLINARDRDEEGDVSVQQWYAI